MADVDSLSVGATLHALPVCNRDVTVTGSLLVTRRAQSCAIAIVSCLSVCLSVRLSLTLVYQGHTSISCVTWKVTTRRHFPPRGSNIGDLGSGPLMPRCAVAKDAIYPYS